MRQSYGLPYKGSKNGIAEWIVDTLPKGEVLVDLFAGGCSVSHCALVKGKYDIIIVNDINDAPMVFLNALRGYYDTLEYMMPVSRETFHKTDDTAIKLMWSFGTDGKTYIYGKDVEEYKKLCHLQKLGIAEVMELMKMFPQHNPKRWKNCQSAMNWLRIHRIHETLPMTWEEAYGKLAVLCSSYEHVPIPEGAVVYCDIPYRGTNCGCYGGFDHEKFYDWCRNQKHDIFVSEYSMPDDFECIAEKTKSVKAAANDNTKHSVEKIFVHRRK